jgi:hypothetical protein
VRVEVHFGQFIGGAAELQLCLFDMVQVEVGVAEGMDEFAGFQAADLRDHHGQQRVGGDVERHAEEDIGAALVELAGEFSVRDIELEQAVAGRQRHLADFADVPCGDDQAAVVGIFLDMRSMTLDDLVDRAAIGRGPAAPLVAVDGAEIAVFIGPFVPDADAVVVQVFDVGVAFVGTRAVR